MHEGDFVALLIENAAARSPLAKRPLTDRISAEDGKAILAEALTTDAPLLRASSATFLEAAAVAFGKISASSNSRRPPAG